MGNNYEEMDIVGPYAYFTPRQLAATGLENPVELATFDAIGIIEELQSKLVDGDELSESERQEVAECIDTVKEVTSELSSYLGDIATIKADQFLSSQSE